ncbi:hypothetical protein [Escherichia fergusonii]|uniref:hypothetical protein n=2 Tax=Escherichia fergusonii TaxID=564 RepID=UPI003B96F54E
MKSINGLHGQGIAHPATSKKRILTAEKRDIYVVLAGINLSKPDTGKNKNRLPVYLNRIYSIPVVAKSTTGRENLKYIPYGDTDAASVFFCVEPAHTCKTDRINGGAGGAAFGLAGNHRGRFLTPASVTAPYERENSDGDFIIPMEAALWLLPSPRSARNSSGLSLPFAATARPLPQQSITLPPPANVKPVASLHGKMSASLRVACLLRGRIMNKPIPTGADLFHLAGECAALVCGLMEYRSSTEHRAMCKSLITSLEALTAAYHADTALPLPDNTASDLSEYWPDESLTLEYCLTLAKALVADTLPRDMLQPLTGLLHDLVNMLADQVKSTTPHRCQGVVLLPFVRRYPAEIEATLDPFVLALYRERREMLCRFKQALAMAGVAYVEADHA